MRERKILALVLIAALLLAFTGCSNAKVEQVDAAQVSEYSDEAAENILIAINEDNYEKYSMDFDETMKKGITEEIFKESNKMIKEKVGEYVSKTLSKAEKVTEKSNEYIVTYYTAKFTNEPKNVAVKVVFSEVDGKKYVTGLWFDSPNLRKK